MHHPTDRIIHTTAFVTPVVEDWLEQDIVTNAVLLNTLKLGSLCKKNLLTFYKIKYYKFIIEKKEMLVV